MTGKRLRLLLLDQNIPYRRGKNTYGLKPLGRRENGKAWVLTEPSTVRVRIPNSRKFGGLTKERVEKPGVDTQETFDQRYFAEIHVGK